MLYVLETYVAKIENLKPGLVRPHQAVRSGLVDQTGQKSKPVSGWSGLFRPLQASPGFFRLSQT